MDTVHFLLVPDRASARRLRRELAAGAARIDVIVGTWRELVDFARRTYLLPEPPDGWHAAFADALDAMPDAFWADSLSSAPAETAAVIERAYVSLLESMPGRGHPANVPNGPLSDRARRHLADLVELHERLDGAVPPSLSILDSALAAPADRAYRRIVVYHRDGQPALLPPQMALLDKLAADAGRAPDEGIAGLLDQLLAQPPAAAPDAALGHVQRWLFEPAAPRLPSDASVQWLAVRDHLEEAEVAAGMIQRALDDQPDLAPSDFALLLPSDPGYRHAVATVFATAGLPLSGLPQDHYRRDLGREAVLLFLMSQQRSARALSVASLYVSPLMPWTGEQGMVLAQRVVDGRHRFRPAAELGQAGRSMVALIQAYCETPRALDRALSTFSGLIDASEDLAEHVSTAHAVIEQVRSGLQGDGRIDQETWDALQTRATPQPIHEQGAAQVSREGVAVFNENEEPWREVRRLAVFGFAQSRYPAPLSSSPVFTDADVVALREALDCSMETCDEALVRRRGLFRRQLSAATDHVTFLIPQRDGFGKAITPSSSLTFMAQLFDEGPPSGLRVHELSSRAGLRESRGVAQAPSCAATPPRPLAIGDPHLGRDLLTLRRAADGTPKPESPSGLETLMVSPLAWLLSRAALEPRAWHVDALGPAERGTLAHEVFDGLFGSDSLPPPDEIRERVPELLLAASREHAPFLYGRAWRVELANLRREIIEAALRWREMLRQLDARVVATERQLRGDLDGLAIMGFVDAIVALPGDVLVVVDYKKSKADKRRSRMEKRYDSQASLYRLMIETGGLERDDDAALTALLRNANDIGVLYYTMNDQRALVDGSADRISGMRGVEVLGTDVSSEAMALIDERIGDVREGVIRLNREDDEKRLDRQGLASYALDRSPLIRIFSYPAEEVPS